MFTFSSSPSPFNGDSTVAGTSGSTSSSCFFSYHPSIFSGSSTVTGTTVSGGYTVAGTSATASTSSFGATFGSTPAFILASSSPSIFLGRSTVDRTSGTDCNSLFGANFGSTTPAFTVSASSPSLFSGGFTNTKTSVTASSSLFVSPFRSSPAFTVVSSSPSPLLGGSTVAGTSVTVPYSLYGASFGSTPAFTVASSSPSPLLGGSTITGTSATASPSPLLGFSAFVKADSPDVGSQLLLSATKSRTNSPEILTSPSASSSTVSSLSEKPCDSTASACFAVSAPLFSDVSSSTEDSASLGQQTSNGFTLFESLSSPSTANPTTSEFPMINSSSSVSPISGLTATTSSLCGEKSSSTSSQPESTVSAPVSATVPAGCSTELQEVTAILASQCNKFLSGQRERQDMTPQAKSSSKAVDDAAHAPDAPAEQKYGEFMPCSVPMTLAPSTSTPSVPLDSNLGSLVLFPTQPAEEEQPYLPSVDLLNSSIEMWERVVAKNKTDQDVSDEGLRHFYEGINYFCLLYERLQEATDKSKDVAKDSDNLEKTITSLEDKLAEACRKLEDSEKEKKRLECKLARAEDVITTLTGDKESLLRVQTLLHQKVSELSTELETGTAAIQKYKASSLYKQELMDYAAPYMGEGVKLAIEKIKAKEPTFDPKTYGLELYMLSPEADDAEFSPSDGGADQEHSEVKPSATALSPSDGGADQEHSEVKPSATALSLTDPPLILSPRIRRSLCTRKCPRTRLKRSA